jgi:hypothetical protein
VKVFDKDGVDMSDTMVIGTPYTVGNLIYARLGGGVSGSKYNVRIRAITTFTDKIEDDCKLKVKDVK